MQTFTKAERLCSKVLIDDVMTKGNAFSHAPFRVSWKLSSEAKAPVQVMISVPKRIYKRAVDRNRVKRLIREAYRLHKHQISVPLNEKNLLLVIVYTAREIMAFQELEQKIITMIARLTDQVNKKEN